jgi:hypothetical protein
VGLQERLQGHLQTKLFQGHLQQRKTRKTFQGVILESVQLLEENPGTSLYTKHNLFPLLSCRRRWI